MKRTRILFCFIFLLCLAPSLPHVSRVLAQQTAAAQADTTTLRLAGLKDRVTIRRDERGIPYIEASNEADLYFAQGYATASDRLWQMDLLRRTARGELAEIFGKAVLDEDKRRCVYGFAGVAEAAVGNLSPPVRAALDAYVRGVNAYISSLEAKSLPPEFQILQYKPREWTAADSLVIGKIFAEVLSTTWRTDIMRAALMDLDAAKRNALLIETSPLDVLVVGNDTPGKKRSTSRANPPSHQADAEATLLALAEVAETTARSLARAGLYIEERAASNNWVVSGKRTASGKPLLANDPHLAASAPSIWYMVHLSAPGLRVAGVAAPGAPGVIIGHNASIAWGLTNLGPDVQDLYLEKFDSENPRRYLTPTGWREAQVRREEIKVRTNPVETTTEIVPLEVTVTRHGPIFFEKDGRRYALRWTSLDPSTNEFAAFYKLNRARNWNEFREALRDYGGPTQNFVYADVNGHIGYYGAGVIPIRKTGDGSLPYDGSTDAGDWTGFIPFDRLPHVYDPPSGIIVTANSRVVGHSYPYHLTHDWAVPYRSRRIYDLLTAKQKLTTDDFRAIQGDVYAIGGVIFAREVVKAAREAAPSMEDKDWQKTLRLLETWDGQVNAESRGAILAAELRDEFSRRIFAAALGAERAKQYAWSNSRTLIDRIITERPREWLPKEYKNYAELLRASNKEVRAALTKRLGADETNWTWGRDAQVTFPHPLARVPLIGQQFVIPPFPLNGSRSTFPTVNIGQSVSMRFIADASDWDKTQQGITLGESGLPSSPHWKDQLQDWRNVTPRIFPFTEKAIAGAAKTTLVLAPE